ncbi:plasmid partitioning protein RepB [Chachezhania antarctica]|uniref:plasmid partitioning protein RepB n=1 Tax=Chachezhania antarctica TaxID=2340860 RepID=UPI000EB27B17|nr:plasmid partitioning protein RepB [Chachezhania antarctica]|tara:strand:- start:4063 stop:5061 length:999 start_codon:yes stop_codon:yes gene_type:complete
MSDSKKRRMSMLDTLAASGGPPTAGSMMSTNRALRSARDAVDSHHVWELDPDVIDDTRIADRLDPADVLDLRDAIEANGQAVPILVRRNPDHADRYLLVYGRRRLEAIRGSDKVTKVRALVATLDDSAAVRTQISENMARRDLTFIEKALFAQELVETGFGNQTQVAEVLTVTKSSVSMAIAIAGAVGADLARAIGPAPGIGRPRWEALAKAVEERGADREKLIEIAHDVHSKADVAVLIEAPEEGYDPSLQAFEAVMDAATPAPKPQARPAPARPAPTVLAVEGKRAGTVKRTAKALTINIENGEFADWIEAEAQDLIADLHARWKTRGED